MSTTIANVGLATFVSVVLICVAGLALDLSLLLNGLPTITEQAGKHPWIAITILGLWQIGGLGLMAHFYER